MDKTDFASGMTEASKDALVNKIMANASTGTEAPSQRTGITTYASRSAQMKKEARYEAVLAKNLSSANGLRKIAANLANPVRQKLDYRGIGRKFCVVEQIPDGVPIIYDRDLPQVPAIKVGNDGSCNHVQMYGSRIELTEFETIARVKIPYKELYTRRFRALDRAKDRLIEGMQLREDLLIYSALGTAATTSNTAITETGALSRDGLAKVVAQIEKNRLVAGSILMTAFGTMGIRRWQYQDLDQVGMQMVRESGYLGNIWGIDFYVTDQLADGQLYAMATPKFNAWMPIRKDADVVPADDPDNFELGMNGYQLWSLTWHNALAAASLQFNASA